MSAYFLVTMSPLGRESFSIWADTKPRVNERTRRLGSGELVLYGPREIPPEFRDMSLDEMIQLYRDMKAAKAGTGAKPGAAKPRIRVRADGGSTESAGLPAPEIVASGVAP